MINERAQQLIKQFEEPKGPRLKAKRDTIATNPTWDIGWGHVITGHEEPDIMKPGQMIPDVTITAEQAQVLFESDIKKFVQGVIMRLNPDKRKALNEDQFGALVSFAYNIGLEGFNKSAVRATINMANPKDAIHGFKSWINSGRDEEGNLIRRDGLIKRRAAESALYQSDYEMFEYFKKDTYSRKQLTDEVIPRAAEYLDLEI